MRPYSASLVEVALSSPVLAAIATGTFAVMGVALTYVMSTRKAKRLYKKKPDYRGDDRLTYAGYETLIKQLQEEIERLRSVAIDREQLIEILRAKESELYKMIEHKDQEISKLRHAREFIERAHEIVIDDRGRSPAA